MSEVAWAVQFEPLGRKIARVNAQMTIAPFKTYSCVYSGFDEPLTQTKVDGIVDKVARLASIAHYDWTCCN